MRFQDARSTVLCKSSHEAGFQNEFTVCLHHLLIRAFLRQALQGDSDKLLGIWPANVSTCLTIFQLSLCLHSKSNVTDSNSGTGSQSRHSQNNTAFTKHRIRKSVLNTSILLILQAEISPKYVLIFKTQNHRFRKSKK